MPEQAISNDRRVPWKAIGSVLLLLFVCTLAVVGWGAYRVVTWAADLPNRIVIDVDEDAIGQVFVESTVMALREGPKSQRLEIIDYLAKAESDIGPSFRAALAEASNDEDAEIAEAARAALQSISNKPSAADDAAPDPA